MPSTAFVVLEREAQRYGRTKRMRHDIDRLTATLDGSPEDCCSVTEPIRGASGACGLFPVTREGDGDRLASAESCSIGRPDAAARERPMHKNNRACRSAHV